MTPAKKGVALFIVLGTILIVVILANVVLNIILSQSRLTHHQVSRIRAYYAGLAGMNFALEQLRTGTWPYSTTYCLRNPNNPAHLCTGVPPANIVGDPDMPYEVRINIGAPNAGGPNFPDVAPIDIDVDYATPTI